MRTFLKSWQHILRSFPLGRGRIVFFLALGLVPALRGQTWQREEIDFSKIEEKARNLAAAPFVSPGSGTLQPWMGDLTYDQYRDIRFNPANAIWKNENLPFQMMLLHPGSIYREPVTLYEITRTHSQLVRFSPDFFTYGPLVTNKGDMPDDVGFAGFRLHAPLNNPQVFDEVAVFQGASYWRALGVGQHYGISARGVAVDTGVEGPEEFPAFRQFWVRKPDAGAKAVEVFALLDGPSVSGAFGFTITPGEETVIDVQAVLFLRKEVKRLGWAPMSSMYWFGENSRRRFDDFRPEVHDSDGLAILAHSGERTWRPLCNDTGKLEFSSFHHDKPPAFGLVQRDRRFGAYEDAEAAYHERPTLWIEPTSDWGPGQVLLMEIPAANEMNDNIVALWQPDTAPKAGDRLAFSYRQRWMRSEDPAQGGGRVVATRTGVHEWLKEQRTVIVEFTGGKLDEIPAGQMPEAVVNEVVAAEKAKLTVRSVAVQALPEKRWRVSFQIAPAAEGGKLADIGPVELHCCLKQGENFLTETWAYRIIP